MNGAKLIAAERKRQFDDEGWSPSHDAGHVFSELNRAAQCYAEAAREVTCGTAMQLVKRIPDAWPWEPCWWKPSDDPVRNLVKAGALLAAEIDRLQAKDGAK